MVNVDKEESVSVERMIEEETLLAATVLIAAVVEGGSEVVGLSVWLVLPEVVENEAV